MKRGSVCSVHNEFSPDGECRWCPTPPLRSLVWDVGEVVDFTTGGGSSPSPIVYGPLQQQSPLPVASCKHDGALLDFSGTISCAACGKVISAPIAHDWTCPAGWNPSGAPCDCQKTT
jgi:hypothetical protein